jgi:hypothetical protein
MSWLGGFSSSGVVGVTGDSCYSGEETDYSYWITGDGWNAKRVSAVMLIETSTGLVCYCKSEAIFGSDEEAKDANL